MSAEARSFVSLLGLKIERSHPKAVSVSVDIEPRHRNSNGVVHGSVFHALLDTCMGLEAWHARGQLHVATAEISVRFLAPVVDGTLIATARVLKAGKRLIVCEGEIRRAGELVAVAQGTFAAIKTLARPAGDRFCPADRWRVTARIMIPIRRLARACLLVSLASPAVALAAPAAKPSAAPAAPASKPAAGDKSDKADKKEPMSDSSAILMLVGLGALGLIGGGIFVATKVMGGKREPDPIKPERTNDWELRLSEPQEAAMLKGVETYRDAGHSLYLSHSDAVIYFYGRRMIVSLHKMTDDFIAAGAAAQNDPIGVVKTILDGYAANESSGVLHLSDDWYATPFEGLDNQKFTDVCYDALTNPQPYIEGSQGSGSDEGSGNIYVKIDIAGPGNMFSVDLRRVLAAAHNARAAGRSEPLIDLVRPILSSMVRGEAPGGMWTRGGASEIEKDLVLRMIASSVVRSS